MKLTFTNVGRFVEKTEININGITVIAGTNGTGKSTISKILYCIFDALHDTRFQIEANRIAIIRRMLMMPLGRSGRLNSIRELAYEVLSNTSESTTNEELVEILNRNGYPLEQLDKVAIDELVSSILDTRKIDDHQILEELTFGRFHSEFNDCIQHVNFENNKTEINLEIRDRIINITTDSDEFSLNKEFELIKDVVYLDDLSAFSNLSDRNVSLSGYDPFNHSMRLREKIFEKKYADNDALDKIMAENRYAQIHDKLNKLEIGELVKSNSGVMEYKVSGLKSSLGMQNVSAGTKVLAVIKKLIENGYVEDNGMIILDEPEVHLHPEWQLALAELIATMNKEMNVNFLINTHSADFVAFVQLYSEKMDIKGCKYYRTVANDKYTSSLIDVTDKIQEIYSELGLPFIKVSEEIMDEEH